MDKHLISTQNLCTKHRHWYIYYIYMCVCVCVCVYIYIYISIFNHTNVCCVRMKILTCTFWSLIHQWGCFQKRLYVLVKRLSTITVTYQDRQYTYKIPFRRVRATFVAVKKQEILHILWVWAGSHRYPACNAHAPYFRLWSVPLCKIFPHYLLNGIILEKMFRT